MIPDQQEFEFAAMLGIGLDVSQEGKTMRKLFVFLLALLSVVGCRDGQFVRDTFVSACGGGGISLTGYTITGINYGDSRLLVLPVSKIMPESEFRFGLIPKVRKTDPPVVYQDAIVSISSTDDDLDTPPNWLDVSGSYNAKRGTLVTCVPEAAGLKRTEYKFDVTVSWPGTAASDTLSMLDPRANVIER